MVNKEGIPLYELPTQKFYFSFNSLIPEMMENRKTQQIYLELKPIIYSYYLESLALLRSTTKFLEIVSKEETQLDKEYNEYISYLDEKGLDLEEEEGFNILFARFREHQKIRFEDLDLEKNQNALGTIVQLLSLMESTLHSIYKKITANNSNLPPICSVCKRENGILKYLKYFEKALIPSTDNKIIIGTKVYHHMYLWTQIRNNIVHNNNEVKEELTNKINAHKLPISLLRNKYIFIEENIRDLANTGGNILDVLIEEVLRLYLISRN